MKKIIIALLVIVGIIVIAIGGFGYYAFNKARAFLAPLQQYAALDKSYMEQAVWAPYGNEKFTTFTSDRINFPDVDFSLLFNLDYSSFQLKG